MSRAFQISQLHLNILSNLRNIIKGNGNFKLQITTSPEERKVSALNLRYSGELYGGKTFSVSNIAEFYYNILRYLVYLFFKKIKN